MKQPKEKGRLKLRRKADKLWSEVIKFRNSGRCEICGKAGTNPHHIIGRKNLTLRHDPRNGILLCYQHHVGGKESAHQDIVWFYRWLVINRTDNMEYLLRKRMDLTTQVDYQKRIEELKELLK